MSMLERDQLEEIGFASLGERVAIDSRVAIFGAEYIHIGSDVRIDCFAVLSAGPGVMTIGDNVHIASGAQLFGGGGIELCDLVGISGGAVIYSVSDDYSQGYLTNPTVPEEFRNVHKAEVKLGKHAIVGARSVVLPGVNIGTGASVGALTLVNKSVPEYAIVSGNPIKLVGQRNADKLQELEQVFRESRR